MVIDVRKFYADPRIGGKLHHGLPSDCTMSRKMADEKNEIKWIWLTGYEDAFPEHSQYYRSEAVENS